MLVEWFRRWRTADKLRRGRCSCCDRVLPDSGPVDKLFRTCSDECTSKMELYRMI